MPGGNGSRVVVVGAGIAGVSVAHRLAVVHGRDVVVVDEREPMSLTSRAGTQAYRNWWPGPDDTMVRFIGRGIDLLDALAARTGNRFDLNRRGYAFLTADPSRIAAFRDQGQRLEALGAGPLREHRNGDTYRSARAEPAARNEGGDAAADGADLLADAGSIHAAFPFVAPDTVGLLHARRCGWLDGAALGALLIDEATRAGARFVRDACVGFDVDAGRVRAVRLASGDRVECGACVLAPGPLLPEVARMLGLELPVFNELHAKLTLPDPECHVPPKAPLMIWCDPQRLEWSDAERRALAEDPVAAPLLGELPAGVHFRVRDTEAGQTLLVIWTFHAPIEEPRFPPAFPSWMAETLARGVARMVPALGAWRGRTRPEWVDGGYYCKTRENRPLIGALPIDGAYVVAALSGFGLMASQAAAELVAACVTGSKVPEYAGAFAPDRYRSAEYQARLPALERAGGQL